MVIREINYVIVHRSKVERKLGLDLALPPSPLAVLKRASIPHGRRVHESGDLKVRRCEESLAQHLWKGF